MEDGSFTLASFLIQNWLRKSMDGGDAKHAQSTETEDSG